MEIQPPREPIARPSSTATATLLHAIQTLDAATWLAMVCIFMGWFVFATLQVSVGPLVHSVRFYDMAAVIDAPVRLFVGIDGVRSLAAIPFGLLCLAAIFSPLIPRIWRNRTAWLACVAPLALMVACAVLLRARVSGDLLTMGNDPDVVGSDLLQLANGLIRRGVGVAARRASIAAGAYLALVGGGFLAVQGVQRYRKGGTGRA